MQIVKAKKLTVVKSGNNILQNVNITLKEGMRYCLIGQSGSGKTTLLRTLAGQEKNVNGKLLYKGENAYRDDQLLPGRPEIRLISQESEVHANISVGENLNYALLKQPANQRSRRISKLLKTFGLQPLRDARVERLSGGERQRLAIAMALATIPDVLLLDEPFNNLDFELREQAIAFISEEISRHNTTALMVSHRPEEILRFADQIIVLKDGRKIQKGAPKEVYFQPKTNYTAGLLGPYTLLKQKVKSTHILNEKAFLRPSQLLVSDRDNGLRVQVTSSRFTGHHHLCTGTTNEGERVLFNSANALSPDTMVSLKIENEDS